jgi:hypothetical protein
MTSDNRKFDEVLTVGGQRAPRKTAYLDKRKLAQMIDDSAPLPSGPDTWNPILEAFSDDLSVPDLAKRFRHSCGERWVRDADTLEEQGARQDILNAYLRHADALEAAVERSGL